MSFKPTSGSLLASILLACCRVPAFAAEPPDAGRLLEETRPALSLPKREAPAIQIEERPALEGDEGVKLHAARFRITGAMIFTEAQLRVLVAKDEGKELSLRELRQLTARITRYYREQGYPLARAYLPAQEIKDGEVEIAVIEGKLGAIALENTAGLGGAALAPLDALRPGAVLRDEHLERSLLLLSDTPGVEVKSTLRPGATIGTSDLLVNVAPGRRITGSADFDTYGNRFTGANRLGGTVNLNNPFRAGDQATLRGIASDERMDYLRASYQLPINALGTRLGAAWSDMNYRLAKDFAPLDADGTARVGSLYALHPFVRSRNLNLNGQLQFDYKALQDRVNSIPTVTDKMLKNWTLGVSGDFPDGLAGAGSNSFSATYTAGDLALDETSRALDAASANSHGSFGKLNLSWLRLQRVTDRTSLYLSYSGQLASKNLNSAEKILLGGANGVRAYPQGEAAGDEGYLVTLEARHNLVLPLPGFWQIIAFADGGHVKVNRNPWTDRANGRTLHGIGAGLNATMPNDWSVRLSVAWKTGSEPATSDVDRIPRSWLQAVKYF